MIEHFCVECVALPHVCKAAVVDDNKRLRGVMTEHESEQGWYWHSRYSNLAKHYTRAREVLCREQMRADRLQAALIKAEKALTRYEGRAAAGLLPQLDDIDAEPRPVADA